MNHSEVWPQEEMFCCGNEEQPTSHAAAAAAFNTAPSWGGSLPAGRQLGGDADTCKIRPF